MTTSFAKGLTDRELAELRFYLLNTVESEPSRITELVEIDVESKRRAARAYNRTKASNDLRVTLAYLSAEDFA